MEDAFEPRLGCIRARGGCSRAYLSRILAAANLARGGTGIVRASRGFSGSRTARAAGVGRLLARRGLRTASRSRRVIVKSRIVRLAGKGAAGAAAHLRYVQRDGTTREGDPGTLYGRDADRVDGRQFLQRGAGDRHQFRFIVSAEDGAQYDDLKPLTRRLMARMEEDLGTRLDWVAVDHFNTGHPHTHIIVRGKDARGKDLIIAPDYMTRGIRERAGELVDLDLGPRTEADIARAVRAEVGQERLTSIDRGLLQDANADGVVVSRGRGALDQTLRAGRLAKLEAMGLATPLGAGRWRLAPDLADTLRRVGERGDIIRTMQREFSARGLDRPRAHWNIGDGATGICDPIVGRVAARGLADEHRDHHYLIVDGIDGRTHYVPIGRADGVEPLGDGAIVRIEPLRAEIRAADRTVAAVAAANGGRYSIDAHLAHDPGASEEWARGHVRRLEAMRRLTGAPERLPDGSWTIASDHVERAAAYEASRLRERPVQVTLLSAEPLERLVDADAATWLDREALATMPEPLRDMGFGADVRGAQAHRRQWLVAEGLAEETPNGLVYRTRMLADLRRRELLRVANRLSEELGLPFAECPNGKRLEGVYRRPVELLSGRVALVERARDFTLVPWRPSLERRVDRSVSGIVRGTGMSWSAGRSRGGPSIE